MPAVLPPIFRGLLLSLLLAVPAAWAGKEPFTDARFAELQAAGALILVDVHADWCPTCAKQQELLDAWEAARPKVELHRLVVDFDNDKKTVTRFHAPRQSTLVLFRGTEQRWFGVAETREDALYGELDRAAGAGASTP